MWQHKLIISIWLMKFLLVFRFGNISITKPVATILVPSPIHSLFSILLIAHHPSHLLLASHLKSIFTRNHRISCTFKSLKTSSTESKKKRCSVEKFSCGAKKNSRCYARKKVPVSSVVSMLFFIWFCCAWLYLIKDKYIYKN